MSFKPQKISAAFVAAATALPFLGAGRADAIPSIPQDVTPNSDGDAGGTVLAQGPDMQVVDRQGETHYEYAQALPGSTFRQLQGSPIATGDSSGCGYAGIEEEGPDEVEDHEVIVEREVAQNLDTCTMTLETATLTEAQAENLGLIDETDGIESEEASALEGVTDEELEVFASEFDGVTADDLRPIIDELEQQLAIHSTDDSTTIDADQFASEVDGLSSEEVNTIVEELSQSEEFTSAAATTRTKGRRQTPRYRDPVGIVVNSVTSRVRWSYTGKEVVSSTHSAAWSWYSPSGWSRQSRWWGHDRIKDWGATTASEGQYHNGVFCFPFDTNTRYNTNIVVGRPNGGVRYEWNAQKWGGCTNLLSFQRVTGNY